MEVMGISSGRSHSEQVGFSTPPPLPPLHSLHPFFIAQSERHAYRTEPQGRRLWDP